MRKNEKRSGMQGPKLCPPPGRNFIFMFGRNDPRYFCCIFEKTQNQTPKEYRASRGA